MKFAPFPIILIFCLSGCAPDKQKHFLAGAAVGTWVYAETGERFTACLASLGAGIAKEVVDSKNGRADEGDALATLAGCSVVWTWD